MSADINIGKAKVIAKHSGTDETTALLALQAEQKMEELNRGAAKSYSSSNNTKYVKHIPNPGRRVLTYWALLAVMSMLFAPFFWAFLLTLFGWIPALAIFFVFE